MAHELTPPGERFEKQMTVQSSDIDEMGHVNNVVYLRWVQDVAIAHWYADAPPADQEKLRWVVVRHEIDYKRPVFSGDEIIASTWVGPASRLAFERHTEVLRIPDRQVLARARTIWCPVDAETGKPTNVSDEVRSRFSTNGTSG